MSDSLISHVIYEEIMSMSIERSAGLDRIYSSYDVDATKTKSGKGGILSLDNLSGVTGFFRKLAGRITGNAIEVTTLGNGKAETRCVDTRSLRNFLDRNRDLAGVSDVKGMSHDQLRAALRQFESRAFHAKVAARDIGSTTKVKEETITASPEHFKKFITALKDTKVFSNPEKLEESLQSAHVFWERGSTVEISVPNFRNFLLKNVDVRAKIANTRGDGAEVVQALTQALQAAKMSPNPVQSLQQNQVLQSVIVDQPPAAAPAKPPIPEKPPAAAPAWPQKPPVHAQQQQAVANAAAAQVAQKAKAANAQLEKEIQSFKKDAILPMGHEALTFVETQDKGTKETDRRYAFTFQPNDKGENTWYLYKSATEGNGIFEVRMVGKQFELDGAEGTVLYDSIADMLDDACDVNDASRTLRNAQLPKEQEMRLVAFTEPAKQDAVVVHSGAAAAVSPKNMQLAVLDMSKPQELKAIVAFFRKETGLPERALTDLVPMHFREQGGKFVMPQSRADQHVFGRALLNLMPPSERHDMMLALTAPRPQAAASSVRIEEMPASPSKATANLAAKTAAEAAAKAAKKPAAGSPKGATMQERTAQLAPFTIPRSHPGIKAFAAFDEAHPIPEKFKNTYAFVANKEGTGHQLWWADSDGDVFARDIDFTKGFYVKPDTTVGEKSEPYATLQEMIREWCGTIAKPLK